MQEALARAWERLQRGERIDSLPAWVTAVALNLARNRLRSLRAELRARHRLGARQADPEPAVLVAERLDVIRAVGQLQAGGWARWRRLVDGLAAEGDARAAGLQQAEE